MTDSDIRTYRATTIHQALQMVEEELGRDAVILHTRQIEHRRWPGVEVIEDPAWNSFSTILTSRARQSDGSESSSDSASRFNDMTSSRESVSSSSELISSV